jgi:hypothetical protein
MSTYIPSMDKSAFAAAALVLSIGTASAQQVVIPVPVPVVVSVPAVEAAHQHIAATMAKYQVTYLVWYGPRNYHYYRGYAAFYSGNGCMSEFGTDPATRAFGVDWSKISTVQPAGDLVYTSGELVRASSGKRLTGFHLYLADHRIAKSVANALEVLRASCQQRTIFDVASG